MLAEIGSVEYLRSHGAPVCAFLPSTSGRTIETATWRDRCFLAVTMAKAEGREWFEFEHSPSTYAALGRALGSIYTRFHSNSAAGRRT